MGDPRLSLRHLVNKTLWAHERNLQHPTRPRFEENHKEVSAVGKNIGTNPAKIAGGEVLGMESPFFPFLVLTCWRGRNVSHEGAAHGRTPTGPTTTYIRPGREVSHEIRTNSGGALTDVNLVMKCGRLIVNSSDSFEITSSVVPCLFS